MENDQSGSTALRRHGSATMRLVSATSAAVCGAGVMASAALLAGMLAIVILQIGLRVTTGASFGWSEEIAKTLMAWGALLAAPDALRRGTQLNLALLIEATSPLVQRIARIGVVAAISIVCARFMADGVAMVAGGIAIRASAVDAPVGLFYLVLPLSMAMFLLVCADTALKEVFGSNSDDPRGEASPRADGGLA